MPKLIDLTGKKFERLLVLERDNNVKKDGAYWICKCDCENIVSVSGKHLRSGHTKSCGCLQKEKAQLIMKKQIQPLSVKTKEKDLTGKTFSYLTVLELNHIKDGKKYWRCKCQCGNEKIISGSDLVTKHTISCGCIRMSQGELKIIEILNKNNINFIKEKSFENCVFKHKLRFDFYINNQYLIEYDGQQHFESNNTGWNTEEHLKETQLRDTIKNNWCKKNDIPLIRIPYTHLDEICLEDLLLETTKYRVV